MIALVVATLVACGASLCPDQSLMMLVTQVGLLARHPRKSVREIVEVLWWCGWLPQFLSLQQAYYDTKHI